MNEPAGDREAHHARSARVRAERRHDQQQRERGGDERYKGRHSASAVDPPPTPPGRPGLARRTQAAGTLGWSPPHRDAEYRSPQGAHDQRRGPWLDVLGDRLRGGQTAWFASQARAGLASWPSGRYSTAAAGAGSCSVSTAELANAGTRLRRFPWRCTARDPPCVAARSGPAAPSWARDQAQPAADAAQTSESGLERRFAGDAESWGFQMISQRCPSRSRKYPE